MPARVDPPTWPPPESVIQALHDRYQREVVEGMNLCPFARRSRELGRVHRPVFVSTDARELEPGPVAEALARLIVDAPDVEIVLLTFPIPPGHRWQNPARFERFLARLRIAWQALPPPREFYMVTFHPQPVTLRDRALTAESLVPLLRRTPDPVIQCVDATMLDHVRKHAQERSRERLLRELEASDPELAALFARSISADPELSSDIARQNFQHVGDRAGLERLHAKIAELMLAREQAYGSGSPRESPDPDERGR